MLSLRTSVLAAVLVAVCLMPASIANAEPPIRVAITTGGHGYETDEFHEMFRSLEGVEFFVAEYPKAAEVFTPEVRKHIDVYVFYDLYQKIDAATKQHMLDTLKEGKGIVGMHHSIASFEDWPEYVNIIGARYFLKPGVKFKGKTYKRSTYKHDVNLDMKVVAKDHPVTKGLCDFSIVDEPYGGYWVSPQSTILLKTEHKESQGPTAWAHQYDASRVVFIQHGHDSKAYVNPSLRKLLQNAIRWTARRP